MKLAEIHDDTVAAALAGCGWRSARGTTHRYTFRDAGARLLALARHGEWEMYALHGKAFAPPAGDSWLHDNSRLMGPVKWVAGRGRAAICRADVPRQWSEAGKGAAFVGRPSQADNDGLERPSYSHVGPRQAWAAALTDFVRQTPGTTADSSLSVGRSFTPSSSGRSETPSYVGEQCGLPLPAFAEQLQRAGWAATVDGHGLLVHLSLPGLYREICLEQSGNGHLLVAATLVELTTPPNESRRAIVALAAEANARLPLVRYAIAAEEQGESLRAEVCLSLECALVPGGWLLTAVEVVEAAVSLSAREMQALRDPELARLVLAANAAHERKEV
jgi:hypothetical protein